MKKKKNKKSRRANAQALLEEAKNRKDRAELEYNDLVIFEKAAKEAYKFQIGRNYEPLPPKQKEPVQTLSAAARLQIQIKEQARVAADLKKNGK